MRNNVKAYKLLRVSDDGRLFSAVKSMIYAPNVLIKPESSVSHNFLWIFDNITDAISFLIERPTYYKFQIWEIKANNVNKERETKDRTFFDAYNYPKGTSFCSSLTLLNPVLGSDGGGLKGIILFDYAGKTKPN